MTTAVDVLRDGHGVCRDFAHLGIALCRALNIPSRYVFGYLPDIERPRPGHADGLLRLDGGLARRPLVHVRSAQRPAPHRPHGHRQGARRRRRGDGDDVRQRRAGLDDRRRRAGGRMWRSRSSSTTAWSSPTTAAHDVVAAREATYVFHNEVTYEYPAPIRALHHQFVVLPRRRHGDQRRITHRVHADVPHRATLRHRYDRFGNPVVEVRAAEVPERFSFGVRAVLHRSRDAADRAAVARRSTRRRPRSRRPIAALRAAAARRPGRTGRRRAPSRPRHRRARALDDDVRARRHRRPHDRRRGVGARTRRVPGHGSRDDRHVPRPGIAGALRVRAPARRGRQPRLGRGPDGCRHAGLRPDARPRDRPALRHRRRRARLPRRRPDCRLVPLRPARPHDRPQARRRSPPCAEASPSHRTV